MQCLPSQNERHNFISLTGFLMQCLPIQNEVPLKRRFLFNGPKKLVPPSESPIYPESQLSGIFLVKFSKEVQGTKENGLS